MLFILVIIISCFVSCIPEPVLEAFSAGDLKPPSVMSWSSVSDKAVLIKFDEEITPELEYFALNPQSNRLSISGSEKEILLEMAEPQIPGKEYTVSGIVYDTSGNCSSFVLPFWGYNPNPPELVINEVLTEKSTKHNDFIEFYANSSGNCAGLCLFIGSPENYTARYVFPELEVKKGDYIVFHCVIEGTEENGMPIELDETQDKTKSGGKSATDSSWDLWYRGSDSAALSKSNGGIALLSSPCGEYLDCFIYTDKATNTSTKYGGFGTSKMQNIVNDICSSSCWKIAGSEPIPTDFVSSVGVTGTRSLCRSSSSVDTDSVSDWHIVPSSSLSPGIANTDNVHMSN